jgi:hypothetical protein
MVAQETTADHSAETAAKAKIADAQQWMARYKAAIDADGDPAEIGAWITEAKSQRLRAETELRQASTKVRATRDQIEALVSRLPDIAATLHDADPATWPTGMTSSGCG